MHELTAPWSLEDERMAEAQLEKLYLLQDRPLGKEKKAVVMAEIVKMRFPLKATLAGLAKLMIEDLKSVKLAHIAAAIKECMTNQPEPGERIECRHCDATGLVTMKDELKYRANLACTCPTGQRIAQRQKVLRWNGERTQALKGNSMIPGIRMVALEWDSVTEAENDARKRGERSDLI